MCIRFIKKGGIDTSDATAIPGDLAKDKTAYVNGQKITGVLNNKTNQAMSATTTRLSEENLVFDENYISGGLYVSPGNNFSLYAQNSNVASTIGLTADKIKKDETILGITGTYEGEGGESFPPDWTEIGYEDTPQSIIDAFNYAKNIYDNWDNTETNLQSKFQNDTTVEIFPLVDCSNATNMISMFNNCTNLKTVSQLNTENVTNMAYMFGACKNLKNIPQFNTSKCRNLNNFVVNVEESLTNESLNNILAMCINVDDNNYIGTKTLKMVGLSQAQAATCQGLSNYQDFLDAGWTTGY